MNPLVISCSILKDEIGLVVEKWGLQDSLDIVWMPESLHNSPDNLKQALQEQIDLAESERPVILLSYGNCGNSLVGLCSNDVPLIVPRYADCISMLLSDRDDLDCLRKHAIFQTRGWLDGEEGLEATYRRLVERRGEARAQRLIGTMYKNYDELLLIDTGAYDVPSQLDRAERMAELYGLKSMVCKGSTSVLERLLTGNADERDFVFVDPHTRINLTDFFCDLVPSKAQS